MNLTFTVPSTFNADDGMVKHAKDFPEIQSIVDCLILEIKRTLGAYTIIPNCVGGWIMADGTPIEETVTLISHEYQPRGAKGKKITQTAFKLAQKIALDLKQECVLLKRGQTAYLIFQDGTQTKVGD